MKRAVLCLLLLATPLAAQESVLLQTVSGTASNPGQLDPHLLSGEGPWRLFLSGSAHVTYVSETGPEEQRNETFSTNWLTAGVHRAMGDRGEFLVRGRLSLEPYTIDEGYPQLLQFVPPDAGGPLVDRMRPHDLFGELAAQLAFRIAGDTRLHLYAAAVGDPALGPVPFAQRASAREFAEAPFAYEIQETFHDETKVVTAGVGTRWLMLEASVFSDAVTTGEHTEIDSDGDIDSQSARITFRPTPSLAIQISRGELGEGPTRRDIGSASLSWGNERAAVSVIYTSRDDEIVDFAALGIEATFRVSRNTFMARVESVDRPENFPESAAPSEGETTSHFAVGYLYDFLASERYRAGVGVNIDYHTQSHELPEYYGHKPQGIYAFVRFRTR